MSKTTKSLLNKFSFGAIGRNALAAQICAWSIVSVLAVETGARIAFEKKSPPPTLPRYEEFLRSQERPDLLVLGSSVALCASFCADETLTRLPENEKYRYTGAAFLQRTLKEKTGQEVTCKTLANSGSMASDAWILTNKLMEFGKKPKVILYETVSRDFFDASMPPIGDTPVYKTIASLHPESKNQLLPKPIVEAMDNVWRSPLVTALTITFADTRFLTDPERLQFCVDSVLSSVSYAYKERTEHRNWLSKQLCTLLNRKSTLHESVQAEYIKRKESNPFGSLQAYQVDSRPQEKRYADELVYFEKLAKVCKENSIELVAVFLPVGKDYEPKVPPQLRKRFPGDCLEVAKRYNIKTFDYSKGTEFKASDFSDFVHLNDSGAIKLTNLITGDLLKGSLLSSQRKEEHNY